MSMRSRPTRRRRLATCLALGALLLAGAVLAAAAQAEEPGDPVAQMTEPEAPNPDPEPAPEPRPEAEPQPDPAPEAPPLPDAPSAISDAPEPTPASTPQPEVLALIEPDAWPGAVRTPVDPEVGEAGGAATIWLHRATPEAPVRPARRLSPAFARMLRRVAARERVDWALVLGVLRAEGRLGGAPAGRARLGRLAGRLVELGTRKHEQAALVALHSRSFAARALAAARLHRAVGLRALVIGLDAAKPALERVTLADRRIWIYSGGRLDVAARRIDVRVLVTLRYLAEAFGGVTVSSLQSGHRLYARPGVISAHVYGRAVDIAGLAGLPIAGHQAPGGITERAVRALLRLPPGLRPSQVISLLGLGGVSFALADHDDHIHVGF